MNIKIENNTDRLYAALSNQESRKNERRQYDNYEKELREKVTMPTGHGTTNGSCGHQIETCRCSRVHKINTVNFPCFDCWKNK